ncbi:MAG: DpnII family type II restriction endonuclease [Prevotella nigrescens]
MQYPWIKRYRAFSLFLPDSNNIESAIRRLWEENKGCFSVLEILIACRSKDKKKAVDNNGNVRLLQSYLSSVDGVIEFIQQIGLKEVLQAKQVKNLVDYVFGVEAGLDTNARKNRSGHLMEGTVASILDAHG